MRELSNKQNNKPTRQNNTTLQRMQRGKKMNPTHKTCINYNQLDNWCLLKNKQVNPDDPACDQYQPREGI